MSRLKEQKRKTDLVSSVNEPQRGRGGGSLMRLWDDEIKHATEGRAREVLKRAGDPSGGNRSGDSRWVPDPSVPVMDVGEKPKARSPSICARTRFYDSF